MRHPSFYEYFCMHKIQINKLNETIAWMNNHFLSRNYQDFSIFPQTIANYQRLLQKMFLTQIVGGKRASSTYVGTSKSTKMKTSLLGKSQSSGLNTPKSSNSRSMHRASASICYQALAKSIPLISGRLTPQQKWKKMVELFQMHDIDTEDYPNLYQCLLKADLQKNNYAFQMPETVATDDESSLQLFFNKAGCIRRKIIGKQDVTNCIQKGHQQMIEQLKSAGKYRFYGEKVDVKQNPNAPFVIIRWKRTQNRFQVQNLRNFGSNKWRVATQCVLQRYVYSRNYKAMVNRVEYNKVKQGQLKQQYTLHRFQNVAPIFQDDSNDSHNLRSILSPSVQRPNMMQYSKYSTPGALSKFIGPASEVKRLVENHLGKKVVKMFVEFIEELTGRIFVIGYRGLVTQQAGVGKREGWMVPWQVAYCRLCNGLFEKRQLQNNVSVRMLLQFLQHLKRRTKTEDLSFIQFESTLSLNRKQNAMSAVCQCCYALIIHQLELKKYQRKLGALCHIRVEDEAEGVKGEGDLRQWRLMVYLQQVKQVNSGVGRLDHVTLRYSLGRGIQQKWKCVLQNSAIPVRKVKIHYFFSQTSSIEEFLKNAQIVISVLAPEGQDIIAQGSTGVLANFKNKFPPESGQRQTTTVLIFFQSGKYCELTMKVGLVYDGVYKSPDVPLRKVHNVLFPTRDWINSNPLPKEWMEAFGYDQQITLKQIKNDDLFPSNKNGNMSKLKKKLLKYT